MSYEIGPDENAKVVPMGTDKTPSGELLEYAWYSGQMGPHEGVVVIRTDRFGQRWRLELPRRGNVTFRVAAGLLNVTPMTISNWHRAGVFPHAFKKKNIMLIPIRDIERIARRKSIALPFAE
jgi:hypothetical protein